jgi:hypothetical protein
MSLSIGLLLVISAAGSDQPATTQSSVTLPGNSPIRRWFDQLADPDPKIRDRAKVDLMGISSDDLPGLRQLVVEKLPISPTQSAALHEIVVQVYLSGQSYKADEGDTTASGTSNDYCLGIFWDTPPSESARLGLCVDQRLAGFPAYRFLRKGDLILGIYINPNLPLETLPNRETHNLDTLKDAIAGNPGTQNVVLDVLRSGESMKIAVKMAPRPLAAQVMQPRAMSVFNAPRIDEADAYWEENFEPLMPSRIDPSNLSAAR